jgi:FtsZ-interacting cell division protein YlmF
LAADVRPNEIIPGEVVTRINRVPVATLADFQRVVDSLKSGDAIVLNLSHFERAPTNRVVQRIVQFTYQ